MRIKRYLLAAVAALAILSPFSESKAQLGPSTNGPMYNPNWSYGYVPTPFQWGLMWSNKMDYFSSGLPIQYGGTGATNAAQARTNLGVLSSSLQNGYMFLGNASNVPVGVLPSGDLSVTNTGVFSVNHLSHVTDGSLANSGLAHSSTTVNGQTCALGSTCTVTAAATSISNATTVTGIMAGYFLFNNAGTLGGVAVIPSTAGGAGSITGALKGNGSGVVSQAACADLSNGTASCSTDTTNASNISSGTLPAGRLPNPTTSSLGGVEAINAVTHQWINSISSLGVPSLSQPSVSDLSAVTANSVLGNGTGSSAVPTALSVPSCSGATNALTWTSATGFGCNTITSGTGSVTSVSVSSGNGFAGSVANPTTTPAITISTSVNGIMKGNGTSASAAVSGTDYAPATSGTSILKGNGSGGFSNATSGTDYAPATSGSSLLTGNGSGGFTNVTALPSGTTATTQSNGDNSTKVATTAYVSGWQRCAADINPSNQQYVTYGGLSAAKSIKIEFDLIPINNGTTLYAQFSQSASFVSSVNAYTYTYSSAGSGSVTNNVAQDTAYAIVGGISQYNSATSTGAAGSVGTLTIPNPQTASPSTVKATSVTSAYYTGNGSYYTVTTGGVLAGSAGPIDGVRLFYGSGNIDKGHVSALCLY